MQGLGVATLVFVTLWTLDECRFDKKRVFPPAIYNTRPKQDVCKPLLFTFPEFVSLIETAWTN